MHMRNVREPEVRRAASVSVSNEENTTAPPSELLLRDVINAECACSGDGPVNDEIEPLLTLRRTVSSLRTSRNPHMLFLLFLPPAPGEGSFECIAVRNGEHALAQGPCDVPTGAAGEG